MFSTRADKGHSIVCAHIILFNFPVDFYVVTTHKPHERKEKLFLVTFISPAKLSFDNGMFVRCRSAGNVRPNANMTNVDRFTHGQIENELEGAPPNR